MKSIRSKLLAVTGALAIVTLATLAYAASALDTAKSSVTLTVRQMNVPVNGKFAKVNGTVDYNAAAPQNTKANLEIDISSIDIGDPEYNKEVLKKEWFNAAQFPKATFVSTSMTDDTRGVLTATGNLTIKGKSLTVSFPVAITKQGGTVIFSGNLPIHRLAFNVGEGDWKDTSMLADEVMIKFHIVVPG